MFLSNKLEALDTYQSDCQHFVFSKKGSFDYLTDRFELYTDQETRIFNHIDGAIPITKRIENTILRDNKTKIHLIQLLPENSENYWTKINDKRYAILVALTLWMKTKDVYIKNKTKFIKGKKHVTQIRSSKTTIIRDE